MRRVKTRLAATSCLMSIALVAAVVAPSAVAAPVPPGPRLAVLRDAVFKGRGEVLTTSGIPTPGSTAPPVTEVFGSSLDKGARGPVPSALGFPVWSPDGTRIIFAAANRARESGPLALFSVAADGGTPKRIPGTTGGVEPVLSPDGQTLAFARTRKRTAPNSRGGEETVFESKTTWTTNLITGATRRLTNWQNGVAVSPSSFSPDGATLAATKRVGSSSGSSVDSAISLPLRGGPAKVIVANALEPTYSPDGTRLAFLRGPVRTRKSNDSSTTALLTDIYAATADGSDVKRLTSTPDATELGLSWDPSGQRLAFTRLHPFVGEAGFLGFGDEIVEINPDGTCPETLISDSRALLLGGTWQPGPGREAGPIAC
jgi:Tol biopolymer transport system component